MNDAERAELMRLRETVKHLSAEALRNAELLSRVTVALKGANDEIERLRAELDAATTRH